MLAGLVVIYAFGVAQLMMVAQLSLQKAVAVGVLPPLPGDIIKVAAAALITLKVRDKIKK